MNHIRMSLSAAAIILLLSVPHVHAQMPKLSSSPMLDCSGLPCVDVTVSGKRLRMLIDTGNAWSGVDQAVAKELGLKVEPLVGRDGKPVPGLGRAVLTGVKLDDATLVDVKVLVGDFSEDIKKNHMPPAQGTLAYTAFKDRILVLDYKRRAVGVSDRLTADVPCPGACGDLTLPTFGKKGPPIVVATGFSVNGKAISAQIDTLFAGTLLIYPTSVAKLGLEQESHSMRKQFFPYTDFGVDMREATAQTEAFGNAVLARQAPVYFATPSVHVPDGMFDGTVGHALLEHSALTLDLRDNRVWLNP